MRDSALTIFLALVVFLSGCENQPSDGASSSGNQKPPTGAWIPYNNQGPLVLTPGGHATWVVDDAGKIITIHPGA